VSDCHQAFFLDSLVSKQPPAWNPGIEVVSQKHFRS
jgi:hypothetical protein